MDLREYQRAVSQVPGRELLVERIKDLARLLRYVTRESALHGYTLEELASLDMEVR